jgi:hypothetical protein
MGMMVVSLARGIAHMVRLASVIAVLGLAVVAMVTAATAQEQKFAPIPRGPIPEQPPCTCRGTDGREFQMGETICLRTADGARIARCEMVMNNTSWIPTATPCPQALRPFTPRPAG